MIAGPAGVGKTRLARATRSAATICRELHADLGGRIRHLWLPGEEGRTSTLDLLGPGYTLSTGPDGIPAPVAEWRLSRAEAQSGATRLAA